MAFSSLSETPFDPADREDELSELLDSELQKEVYARVYPARRRGLPDGRIAQIFPRGVDDVADLFTWVEE